MGNKKTRGKYFKSDDRFKISTIITKEKPFFKKCIFKKKITYKSCTVSSMINDKNKWDGKWWTEVVWLLL